MIKNNLINDIELLIKIRKNDLEALALLYDRYSPLLYAFIKKIVVEQKLANSVIEDTFLIIWRWAEEFDFEIYNVYTWMILIARNKALDTIKRNRGDELPEYSDEYEINMILPKLSYEIESIELEHIIKLNEKILAKLNELDEEQHSLFSLAYYEGLDERMISEKLDIPVATVKPQLQYTMEVLMQKLIK